MLIREGHGDTRNLFQCGSNEQGEDQKKKVFGSTISTNSGHRLKILCDFSRILKCRIRKKRSSSQTFYEIRCESTKIAKIRAVNTNLGVLDLDLHFNSPEPVNFFGAQSSLGGAQFSFGGAQAVIWGGHGPGMPPRGAGPGSFKLTWTFSEFKN